MGRRSGTPGRINTALLVGSAALTLALVLAGVRQARPAWARYTGSAEVRILTPTLTGQPELCLTCHQGIEEISPAHPIETFGCVRCHGGDRLSLDKDAAHAGMFGGRNPAALPVANQGCGGSDCHGGAHDEARDHIARVERSVQATYAGAINSVLFSFNLAGEGDPHYGISEVADDARTHPDAADMLAAFDPALFNSPVATAFSETCLTCHLDAEPILEPYYYRSVGCSACHVVYSADGLYTGGDPTIPRDEPGHPARHQMTLQIPFSQCNACHNRGNYSLAQMRFIPRDDLDDLNPFLAATERRLAEYYQPIGLFTLCEWELDCIDCHTTQEAMGDGDIHLSQASAQSVECRTCHGTLDEPPVFKTITEADDPAIRRANLHPFYDVAVGDQVLLAPDGDTLGAVQFVDGEVRQIGKVTGISYVVPPVMGSACEQRPDQQESRYCHTCHAFSREVAASGDALD